jgi:hypothetical protein
MPGIGENREGNLGNERDIGASASDNAALVKIKPDESPANVAVRLRSRLIAGARYSSDVATTSELFPRLREKRAVEEELTY